MAEKSDPQGGTRTKGRHVGELSAGGALALLLVSFVPEGWMDPFQMNLSGVVLTGAFSTAAKLLHESGGILKLLGRAGLVVLLAGSIGGCAVNLGRSSPTIHTGADGETIVACEIVGVSLAFGSASVCRNAEGGHVGRDFVNLFTGTVGAVARVIGGVFGGFGAIGAGITAAVPEPVQVAPEPEVPAVVIPRAGVTTNPTSPSDWFE